MKTRPLLAFFIIFFMVNPTFVYAYYLEQDILDYHYGRWQDGEISDDKYLQIDEVLTEEFSLQGYRTPTCAVKPRLTEKDIAYLKKVNGYRLTVYERYGRIAYALKKWQYESPGEISSYLAGTKDYEVRTFYPEGNIDEIKQALTNEDIEYLQSLLGEMHSQFSDILRDEVLSETAGFVGGDLVGVTTGVVLNYVSMLAMLYRVTDLTFDMMTDMIKGANVKFAFGHTYQSCSRTIPRWYDWDHQHGESNYIHDIRVKVKEEQGILENLSKAGLTDSERVALERALITKFESEQNTVKYIYDEGRNPGCYGYHPGGDDIGMEGWEIDLFVNSIFEQLANYALMDQKRLEENINVLGGDLCIGTSNIYVAKSSTFIVGDSLKFEVEVSNLGYRNADGVKVELSENSNLITSATVNVPAQSTRNVNLTKGNTKSMAPGTYRYTFTVKGGDVNKSNNEVTETLEIRNYAPELPYLKQPTNPTGESITLTWTKNRDGDFLEYWAYSSSSPDQHFSRKGNVTNRETTSYTTTNLYDGTKYYFKIISYDTNGLYSESNVVSGLTLPKMRILNVNESNHNSLKVTWTKTLYEMRHELFQHYGSDLFKQYNVKYSKNSSFPPGETNSVTVGWRDVTETTINNLEPGTNYYFIVETEYTNGAKTQSWKNSGRTLAGNKLPTARLNDATIKRGETARMNASKSSDQDGTIVKYEWEFEGHFYGQTTYEPYAEVKYNDAGDYTVKVTVTDDDGATDTAEAVVRVTKPDASVNWYGIDVYSYPPVRNEDNLIRVQVSNEGTELVESCTLAVDVNGSRLWDGSLGAIEPRGWSYVDVEWTPQSKGEYNISVEVDSQGDGNTSNNKASRTFWVKDFPKADLAVYTLDFTIDPEYPRVGEEAVVYMLVRNRGVADLKDVNYTGTFVFDGEDEVEGILVETAGDGKGGAVIEIGGVDRRSVHDLRDLYEDIERGLEEYTSGLRTVNDSGFGIVGDDQMTWMPTGYAITVGGGGSGGQTIGTQNASAMGGTPYTTSLTNFSLPFVQVPAELKRDEGLDMWGRPDKERNPDRQIWTFVVGRKFMASGTHKIGFYADFKNDVEELNEDNNYAETTVNVDVGKPDLTTVSSEIWFTPEKAKVNETVTCHATIWNIGGVDSGAFWTAFYLNSTDGEMFHTQEVESIQGASYATKTLTVELWVNPNAMEVGRYNVCVYADYPIDEAPAGIVTELREDNNHACSMLEIVNATYVENETEAEGITSIVTSTTTKTTKMPTTGYTKMSTTEQTKGTTTEHTKIGTTTKTTKIPTTVFEKTNTSETTTTEATKKTTTFKLGLTTTEETRMPTTIPTRISTTTSSSTASTTTEETKLGTTYSTRIPTTINRVILTTVPRVSTTYRPGIRITGYAAASFDKKPVERSIEEGNETITVKLELNFAENTSTVIINERLPENAALTSMPENTVYDEEENEVKWLITKENQQDVKQITYTLDASTVNTGDKVMGKWKTAEKAEDITGEEYLKPHAIDEEGTKVDETGKRPENPLLEIINNIIKFIQNLLP